MNTFLTFIGTIAAIVAAYFTIRNDKAFIRKCIRKKEREINYLQSEIFRKYRNQMGEASSPEQMKIDKLKKQISDLEDRL